MIQKTGNLILLAEISILVTVLVAGNCDHHAMAQQCDCEKVFNLLNTINGKLDKLLDGLTPEPVCKPITGLKSIDVDKPKMVLNDIDGAHGLETKGNDLYIAGLGDGYVYHYNTQEGGSKPTKLITSNIVGGKKLKPAFLDIHDDVLYVTNTFGNSIYQIPLNGGAKKLTQIGDSQPVGIKFSPDGQTVIIDVYQKKGLIHVYDKTITKLFYTINAKADCGSDLREIAFLSDDKFFLSTYGSDICIYQKDYKLEKFTHVKPNIKTSSQLIDGFYVHCDGTIIATDRQAGRLIQMDKNFNTIDTLSGFQFNIIDVAVTDDGTLAVSNHPKDTVKLYSLW